MGLEESMMGNKIKGHTHDNADTTVQEIRRINEFVNDEGKCNCALPPNCLAARTKIEV